MEQQQCTQNGVRESSRLSATDVVLSIMTTDTVRQRILTSWEPGWLVGAP